MGSVDGGSILNSQRMPGVRRALRGEGEGSMVSFSTSFPCILCRQLLKAGAEGLVLCRTSCDGHWQTAPSDLRTGLREATGQG